MRTIFRRCYESNSSSSHSISLDETFIYNEKNTPNNLKQIYNPKNLKSISFEGGEFGWGIDRYNEFYTKANYVAQYIISYENKFVKNLFETVLNYYLDYTEFDYSGVKGYIDHQSFDVLPDSIACKSDMVAFLFGNSTLYIDNDNH